MKLIKALSTVIAIVGLLVFAVGGKFVVTNMLNKENKIATKAIVEATFSFSNDGKNKLAWISYEVNGEKHNASLSNESNRFRNGQEIDIYYHKDDINILEEAMEHEAPIRLREYVGDRYQDKVIENNVTAAEEEVYIDGVRYVKASPRKIENNYENLESSNYKDNSKKFDV